MTKDTAIIIALDNYTLNILALTDGAKNSLVSSKFSFEMRSPRGAFDRDASIVWPLDHRKCEKIGAILNMHV